jgi:hypothetical protein
MYALNGQTAGAIIRYCGPAVSATVRMVWELSKDVIDKLKRVKKLSRQLRGELTRWGNTSLFARVLTDSLVGVPLSYRRGVQGYNGRREQHGFFSVRPLSHCRVASQDCVNLAKGE